MASQAQQLDQKSGDDAAIIAQLAARDADALRSVIGAHGAALHRIAYRMTHDAHEAEDIAQEAMLKLWDNAAKLEARAQAGNLNLAAWLKRVTINLSIDRLRKGKRIAGSDIPESADESPLADAQIEEAQSQSQTRQLVESLPERQRAAIVLTYYEELPNADAASVMEMQLKAFESLLHRARASLRKAFEAEIGQQGSRV